MQYDNALDFIATVRHAFAAEPWVFDAFVVVLSEYRKQQIDIDDLMTHMRAIFSSHDDLFDLFCRFLPNQEQPCCPSALDFVSYVKARSSSDVYSAFLGLLNDVDRGQLAVTEMYSKTCALFRQDTQLLAEFECFFRGDWATGDDLSDLDDEMDAEGLASVQSSPSPSVESFNGVQTPKDSGSPLPRSLNLKSLSLEPQPELSVAGEWNP
ncbi:paired amphipathic helix protein SIN3 [Rhizoctonia solani AG-3 Rhs1AP]|uniref:Paired amphipathic helix protein SIN3 n=1 Tax=Rhizoctonia solani AG-3 Rhs1AP TaxID=1086054 RepID=X8JBF3_9AGAM|nr:paired amphipathic helix protein SIN3 [Rhizoctonia solani AG-3 Rhs1AP]